jgi:lipid A ethanolaminephosphotransferase
MSDLHKIKALFLHLHPRIGPAVLSLGLALLFTFVYNFALVRKASDIVTALPAEDIYFIASIPLLPICVFNLLFVLLCIRRVEKAIFSTLIVVSSLVSYGQLAYGTIYDDNMIRNFAETEPQEAAAYLSISLLTWLALTCALPLWLLWKTKIHYGTFKHEIKAKATSVVLTMAVIGLIATFNYDDYATTIRNNTSLRAMPVPFYALKNTKKYIKQKYFKTSTTHIARGEDARQTANLKRNPQLVVLIVGETQRAQNYQLNGYPRDTNEFTIRHGVTSFRDFASCGTATAQSVPCMFSGMTRADFSISEADGQDNAVDILKRAGIDVTWLENDGGCKNVCTRVKTIDLRKKYMTDPRYKKFCLSDSCFDEVFIEELDQLVPKLPKDKDALVVLHVMGSHGPAYYERYPLGFFQTYMPDCDRSDIQHCTQEELINEYDNTIRHFDYVMAKIIDRLKEKDITHTPALVFVSDHGESLGENNIYLHGLPYIIAPAEQTTVPFITWIPDNFSKARKIDSKCLKTIAAKGGYSHENLFDTLLGLFDVQTSIYRPERDIFRTCAKT